MKATSEEMLEEIYPFLYSLFLKKVFLWLLKAFLTLH